MLRRILRRRALSMAAIVAAAAIGSVAGVSLAQGNGAPAMTTAAGTQTGPSSPEGILAGVHQILSALVTDGTIDQQQADVVQARADAGSIDPKQLVDSGVVTDAQMRAIAERLDGLKRSYSP